MEDVALTEPVNVPRATDIRGANKRRQLRKVRLVKSVSKMEHVQLREPGDDIPIGTATYVKYHDHVFYKDAEEIHQIPRVLEAVGKLSHLDETFIRLTFEQYPESADRGESKVRSMGLVILRSNILEVRSAIDNGKS